MKTEIISRQTLMMFDLIFYMKLKKASTDQVYLMDQYSYMDSPVLRTSTTNNIKEADNELKKWYN